MLSREDQALQIWMGMLDAERAVRYCEKFSDKMKFRHQLMSTVLALFAGGAVAPVLAPVPQYLTGIALAIVAVLSIWFLLADYSGKAATSKAVAAQYRDLVVDWQALWVGEATQQEILRTQQRFARVHSGGDLGNDRKLNKEAMNEAERILWAQHGVALPET